MSNFFANVCVRSFLIYNLGGKNLRGKNLREQNFSEQISPPPLPWARGEEEEGLDGRLIG